MNKKNTAIRAIVKHQFADMWYNNQYHFMVKCKCGWEDNGESWDETDDLLAGHQYSMIKEALKKRKNIRQLAKKGK